MGGDPMRRRPGLPRPRRPGVPLHSQLIRGRKRRERSRGLQRCCRRRADPQVPGGLRPAGPRPLPHLAPPRGPQAEEGGGPAQGPAPPGRPRGQGLLLLRSSAAAYQQPSSVAVRRVSQEEVETFTQAYAEAVSRL